MALSHITSLSTLQSPFHKLQFVGVSQNRRELIIPTEKNSRYHLVSLCHTARRNRRTISCVAGEVSSTPSTTISSIFVKGLADSVSEGRLKKVFSQFGQVSHGYGYLWFNKKEDAQLAVEAMNGKFFDGRFILVKFGQPGLSRRRRPNSDFLFVNK
ncbi:hypothetical protein HID58_050909 [Brassica napus]|uniref:RRM domain-containing protein n=1 Tax=Brassica napus TaxID=3708 RepID=A0ABQ8A7G2_BRANA|nr:hypothetical protein HID58_050909 [Brassica napus]